MAQDNKELAGKLERTGSSLTPLAFENKVRGWFKVNGKAMTTLMGDQQAANRLLVAFMELASRNPKLIECSIESLGTCLLHSATLGLFPGPMQECAYVPFKGVATFIPQYQGLIKLAYNSGLVRAIRFGVVRDGDEFSFSDGLYTELKHTPLLDDETRGEIRAVWIVIQTETGANLVTVKGRKFIDSIRDRSPAYQMAVKFKSTDSPWMTDYEAMAVKTVLKQALKMVPKSPALATAIQLDNEDERGDLKKDKIVDVSFNPQPADKSQTATSVEQTDAAHSLQS